MGQYDVALSSADCRTADCHRVTANCTNKLQTRPLVKQGSPQHADRNLFDSNTNLVPDTKADCPSDSRSQYNLNLAGVRRQRLAFSVGPTWVSYTWRWRQNSASKPSCFKWTNRQDDGYVQNCVIVTYAPYFKFVSQCISESTLHYFPFRIPHQ
jgi:hypothetical protein